MLPTFAIICGLHGPHLVRGFRGERSAGRVAVSPLTPSHQRPKATKENTRHTDTIHSQSNGAFKVVNFTQKSALLYQNLPAKLLAASEAEILDLPLAVPDEPELSVPNGLGLPTGLSKNIDCVPAIELGTVDVGAAKGFGACIDWDKFGVPNGDGPADQVFV